MRSISPLSASIACCWVFALAAPLAAQRAADKFQNVTTLPEMPAEQMGKVMNIMSAALGVGCAHCHVGYDFAREDAPHKATARRMIAMTLALNRDHFGGRTVITCITCHQGQSKVPDATLSASTLARGLASEESPAGQGLPESDLVASEESLEQVMQRYPQLTGRTKNGNQLSAIRWPGQRLEPSGKSESIVMEIIPPHIWQLTTYYGQLEIVERYEAGQVTKRAGDKLVDLKPDEAAQIKLEARLALGLELRSQLSDWSLAGAVAIDGQPMSVIEAREGQLTHRFYFDPQSTTLRRRTTATPTVLGAHITEVDYTAYEPRDGRILPKQITFRQPALSWTLLSQ